ncbi:MAG TPA: glycosyltransferase family 4 protein [Chloroflexota bacterium]|nr:glycosyltransferase family 4 protein [Chloroflexota bacterium]
MQRLKILIWHIHGSYLNALARTDHDWYLPTKPGKPSGYMGKGPTFDTPDNVHEVPAERVRDLDLDLIIYQTSQNLHPDAEEILTARQRALPSIYLEHNTPKASPYDARHPVDDPTMLLVHVTHFNRLMWDNGQTPTAVVEHSVAIAPDARYRGTRPAGITIVNGMQRRPRIAGYDIFLRAREDIPLDIAGMETEEFGGLGDIPYRHLHHRVAEYRFLFSPMRYTSLPLAVIEGMTIGMPIVALATTEVPSVLQDGVHGFISCDVDYLIDRMRYLIAHPEEARALGENARALARERFSLDRFRQAWDDAFGRAIALRRSSGGMAASG